MQVFDISKYIINGKLEFISTVEKVDITGYISKTKKDVVKAFVNIRNDNCDNIRIQVFINNKDFVYKVRAVDEKKPYWTYECNYETHIIHDKKLYTFYIKERNMVERMIKIKRLL